MQRLNYDTYSEGDHWPSNVDLRSKEWNIKENATAIEVLELGARVRRFLHDIPLQTQAGEPNDDLPAVRPIERVPVPRADGRDRTHHAGATSRGQAATVKNGLGLFSVLYTTTKRVIAILFVAGIYLLLGSILCSIPSISHNLRWQGATCENGVFGSHQLWDNAKDYVRGIRFSQSATKTSTTGCEPVRSILPDIATEDFHPRVDRAHIKHEVGRFKRIHYSISQLSFLTLDLLLPTDALTEESHSFENTAIEISNTDVKNKTQTLTDHQDLARLTLNAAYCSMLLTTDSVAQAESIQTHLQRTQAVHNDSPDQSSPDSAATNLDKAHDILVEHLQYVADVLVTMERNASACQLRVEQVRDSLERTSTSLEQGRQIVRARLSKWSFERFTSWFTHPTQKRSLPDLSTNYTLLHEEALACISDIVARVEETKQDVEELLDMVESDDDGSPLASVLEGSVVEEISAATNRTLTERNAKVTEMRRLSAENSGVGEEYAEKSSGPSLSDYAKVLAIFIFASVASIVRRR